jgi:hypothetical protein
VNHHRVLFLFLFRNFQEAWGSRWNTQAGRGDSACGGFGSRDGTSRSKAMSIESNKCTKVQHSLQNHLPPRQRLRQQPKSMLPRPKCHGTSMVVPDSHPHREYQAISRPCSHHLRSQPVGKQVESRVVCSHSCNRYQGKGIQYIMVWITRQIHGAESSLRRDGSSHPDWLSRGQWGWGSQ